MRNRFQFVAATLLALTLAIWAQPSSSVVGWWQADKQGSPWVTLNVTREKDSKLGGTAVFYVLDKTSSDTPPRVLGKQEVQLVDPKLMGNVFSFEVRNQQGVVTMNPSSDELLGFEMILKDKTHARLKSKAGGDAGILLVKKE
jgi:hypothetical protein